MKKYERATLEAVLLTTKDVITTSGEGNGVIVLPPDDLASPTEIFG